MYLTTKEACDRLRLSRWTLRTRIAEGEITAHKGPAPNSPLRIDAASVLAYERRRTISPPVPVFAGSTS